MNDHDLMRDYDLDPYCPDPTGVAVLRMMLQLDIDEGAESEEDPRESQLCRRCRAVELRPDKLAGRFYYSDILLGSFRDVLSRTTCPLCRLAVAAITEFRREVDPDDPEHPFGIDPAEPVELSWDPPSGFSVNLAARGSRITFVDDVSDDEEDIESDGDEAIVIRRARILSESYMNPTCVVDWLFDCQEHHGDACAPPVQDVRDTFSSSIFASVTYAFRLIDVRSYTVVEVRPSNDETLRGNRHPPYVALSYVWGRVHSLRLLQANREELMKPGGLKRHWAEIPQTIKDAIMLTRQLEKRYLWVDCLCLVQDHEVDMLQGIARMNLIYAGAVLTIIAAAGPSAAVGLPGVRFGTRRLVQRIEKIKPGLKMTIVNSLDDMLVLSHYSGRAWTFQEQLFSNRTVIFTPDGGVHFRCLRALWSEQTTDDEHPEINNYEPDHLYTALSNRYPPALAYDALLVEFTKRSLTHQYDALNAFGGLVWDLSARMKCAFLQGLPTAAFDFYLLFAGHWETLERRECFPSWSWAGWMGCLCWYMRTYLTEPASLADWLDKRTWIVWYHREKGGAPRSVWDPRDQASAGFGEKDIGYRTRSTFKSDHAPHIDASRTVPTADFTFGRSRSYPCLLQFWTVSLQLKISRIVCPEDGGKKVRERGTIVDRDDHFCGSIRLDGYFVSERDLGQPMEFIILSETRYSMAGSEIDDRDEWSPELTKDPDFCDLYWVMLIQRNSDDVAERRGLGQIFHKALATSCGPGPAWKEIILG